MEAINKDQNHHKKGKTPDSSSSYVKDGEQPVFRRKEDLDGYNIEAWYLNQPNNGNALIYIFKDGKVLREFLFPAYKIYNLQAHFEDILEGEKHNSANGYEAAVWNGISGAVVLT